MAEGIVKFVSCPTDNCPYGEVRLTEHRGEENGDPVVLAGFCESCGYAAVECSECENVTSLLDGSETQCDGCDAVYQQMLDRKGIPEGFRRVR